MRRHTAQNEQVRKHVDDVIGIQSPRQPNGQRLAGEFIDDVQHPDLAPIVRAILNKVISPNMIWPFWLEPDARTVVQPQP